MNTWINMLLAAVPVTGDEANMGKWIAIMVVVGVLLVIMAVASFVASKKQNAQGSVKKKDTQEDKKE